MRLLRVLVCGGRDYRDRAQLFEVLDLMHRATEPGFHKGIGCIINGAARGADTLSTEWATARDVSTALFPADWERDGKAAGPIRNRKMLDFGAPDVVVAFPGGRGTADMVAQAKQRLIRIIEVAPRTTQALNTDGDDR